MQVKKNRDIPVSYISVEYNWGAGGGGGRGAVKVLGYRVRGYLFELGF